MCRRQKFLCLLGFLFLSVGLVQCGTYSECVRFYNAIYNKQGTCPGGSSAEYEQKAKDCASRLEQCTTADRERARDMTVCIEQLPVCDNAISHAGRLLSCYTRLSGVSGGCAAAFARP